MSYFNQFYNWYYDIHPWRPTMEDYKRKNLVIKQINDTKQFKFKNRKNDEALKQVKNEMLNKIKEFKSRNKKVDLPKLL